jgi:hypothetical protein
MAPPMRKPVMPPISPLIQLLRCGAKACDPACEPACGAVAGCCIRSAGADALRDPLLPDDLPPPARAQASYVDTHSISPMTTTLAMTMVRFINRISLQ